MLKNKKTPRLDAHQTPSRSPPRMPKENGADPFEAAPLCGVVRSAGCSGERRAKRGGDREGHQEDEDADEPQGFDIEHGGVLKLGVHAASSGQGGLHHNHRSQTKH
jgi:hypothetical protein